MYVWHLHNTSLELRLEVVSTRGGFANVSDETLLTVACRVGRVLVTEDKDFASPACYRLYRAPFDGFLAWHYSHSRPWAK